MKKFKFIVLFLTIQILHLSCMKDINEVVPEQLGGLLRIFVIPENLITNFLPINGKVDYNQLNISDNTYSLYITPESLEFTTDVNEVESGINEVTKITAFTPKYSKELKNTIEKMENNKFVVIIQDGGIYSIFGNKEKALNFTANESNGKKTGDINGYNIAFEAAGVENNELTDFFPGAESNIILITNRANLMTLRMTIKIACTQQTTITVDWGDGVIEDVLITGGLLEEDVPHAYPDPDVYYTIIISNVAFIRNFNVSVQQIYSAYIPEICTQIRYLNLRSNYLTEFETFASWSKLVSLNIAGGGVYNQITSLILHETYTSLALLYIYGTAISELNVANTALQVVNCLDCGLNQSTVDALLLKLDSFESPTYLNVSGGTNAVPTGGIFNANYVSLINKGSIIYINT